MDSSMQRTIEEYKRILTPQQAAELSSKTREGDRDAYEKLYYSNLRLAKFFARGLYHLGEREDIDQASHEGLCDAIKGFDPSKGLFSVYAKFCIQGAIFRNALDNRCVRIPPDKILMLWKINEISAKLFMEYQREPDYDEIAQRMRTDPKYKDIKTDEIIRIQSYVKDKNTTSLNETVGEDDDTEVGDFYEDENAIKTLETLVSEDEKSLLLKKVKLLSPREQEVIDWLYTENLTKAEIQRRYGVDENRVAQIERKALNKLRVMLIKDKGYNPRI